MKRTLFSAALALAFTAAPSRGQTPWVHIEVNDNEDEGSQVKVNLPLSVVEIALEAAPEKIVDEGKIRIHDTDHDLDVDDLRRMWNALRNAPESEWVTVEQKDENVSIRRAGEEVLIDVDDRKGGDTAHIRVPVKVVDALFSGEGQELNLKEAISELKALRGDIVRVDDGETKVRIWIDEKD